jgi:hypothetical protein
VSAAEVVFFAMGESRMFDVPDLLALLRSGDKVPPGVFLIRPEPTARSVDHLIGAMRRFGLNLEKP